MVRYIRVTGKNQAIAGMEEVYKYGQMELDMKGIGSKIRQIIKES